ncbi:MAG: hypothetical protein LBK56_12360 [Gracilibacteraceae bacterium]|jgi:hypothetical protein|nr:hypothetical protein [Gracilibacteraceae bacterium]
MSASIPGLVTRTLLCVDSISSADISGRFYNLYLEEPARFQTIKEFLDKMGDFFDTISFPQNFFDFRYFREENKETTAVRSTAPELKKYWSEALFDAEKGEQGTFIFQVRYRQRAEWQGTLTWVEQKKQTPFRSALEFIRLINAAFDAEGDMTGWTGQAAGGD